MQWLYSVPLFPLCVMIIAVFVGVGLAGMWLTQKFILPRFRPSAHDNEFTGAIIHGMLVIYGLAVALIVVAVWENYADVSKLVSREATAIAMLYRDAGSYPDSTRERLQLGLRTYTDEIINEAWPLQRRGIVPTQGVELMDNLEDVLFAFTPTTDAQKILHAEAMHAYNNLIEARRLRLDAVRSGLPGAMWAVVLLGALISLTSTFMFRVESIRLHYTMISLLATLMALVVFLILIYDSPFRGTHGVGSEAYELIRDHLMMKR